MHPMRSPPHPQAQVVHGRFESCSAFSPLTAVDLCIQMPFAYLFLPEISKKVPLFSYLAVLNKTALSYVH